jgi:hypothetical protein
MNRFISVGVALVILCGAAGAEEGVKGKAVKKLIEFGWDEPDPAFMRKHVEAMEKTPFDGCVFHVNAEGADGKVAGRLTWEGWAQRTFTDQELRRAVEDLKATRFKRFTHNFLRFNTTPAKLDWFDDHSAVIANAKLAAKVAREGKCAGVLFDIEQYEGQLWNYRKQRDAATKSWDQYAAKARERGREVMNAFQEGYPGVTVFLTFGHSLPWAQCAGKTEKLPDAGYGLLAPFLDGMVDATNDGARLVDGHELSYGYKDPARFDAAYRAMSKDLLAIVGADREKYRKSYSFGFGIWMDNNHRRVGWDEKDFSKNHFTPEVFGAAVRKALETSDEYVWVYTEMPRWWSEGGGMVKMPGAYVDGVRKARAGLTKD